MRDFYAKPWVDRYHGVIRAFSCIWLVPIAYFISHYALRNPQWAQAYTQGYIRYVGGPLSRLTGMLPFSVAEVLIFVLAAWVILGTIRLLYRGYFLRAVAMLVAVASILYAFFAAGWGVAYARLPYAEVAGLDVRPAAAQELRALCVALIERTNDLRNGAREDGAGLYQCAVSDGDLLREVPAVYTYAAQAMPWLAGTLARPKPVFLSEAMSHMQISGIYIPYTGEANINMNNKSYMLPLVAAHEGAHQRGWAREDEANYIAYAVCTRSANDDFVYSGTLFGLLQAMNALAGADMDAYTELRGRYGDGLNRDMQSYAEHWKRYEGKASEVHERVNDAYLKANNQQDGVRSYGRMVDLMLAEYLQRGALPALAPSL